MQSNEDLTLNLAKKFTYRCLYLFILIALCGCAENRISAKRSSVQNLASDHESVVEFIRTTGVVFRGPDCMWSGSAIHPDGYVVTAWHGVERYVNAWGTIKHGDSIKGKIVPIGGSYGGRTFHQSMLIAAYPSIDVAIVKIDTPTPDFLRLSEKGPIDGDLVFLVGGSTGLTQVAAGTYFACSDEIPAGKSTLWVDVPAFSGDSGGGLVNERGEMLGAMVSVLDYSQLRRLTKDGKSVFSGRTYATVCAAIPPQLLDEMIEKRGWVDFSHSVGLADEDWNLIRLVDRAADVK